MQLVLYMICKLMCGAPLYGMYVINTIYSFFQDVAQFLQKNSGIDLLLGVVIRANSLRLTVRERAPLISAVIILRH